VLWSSCEGESVLPRRREACPTSFGIKMVWKESAMWRIARLVIRTLENQFVFLGENMMREERVA
jgi:hypothetical protein